MRITTPLALPVLLLVFSAIAGCGGSSGTDAGNADVRTAPTACEGYCALIQSACTGANMQYADTPACMAACAGIPVGDPGVLTGNTLSCRSYHAAMATSSTASVHCPHAGPTGGGICE